MTGLFRGQCAELCGRDHGFMPIVIDVRSKADFAAWMQTQKALQQPAEPSAAAAAAAAAASAAAAAGPAHTS